MAFNPKVQFLININNTLIDEKIDWSFHLALGSCFDGTLIRKDGRFVLTILSGLNPEKLLGK